MSFYRKLKKLVFHPINYFIDAHKNRRLRLGDIWLPVWQINSYKSSIKYTVISAVYNVEKYIVQYITSLENQKLVPSEIILVDDGSTDNTKAEIIALQNKFANIQYVYKENGGQSSARNVGLSMASGDYVTFIDPDDFVDSKYFENVDKCIRKTKAELINCNIIIYREAIRKYTNNHFLKRIFKENLTFSSFEIPDHIVINNTARSFFKLSLIKESGLQFNEKIREFEDGLFTTNFIQDNLIKIAICKEAKYLNRRRADETSTMQTSWKKKHAFTDVFKEGYLKLISQYKTKTILPIYVQRTLMTQLSWHIMHFINCPPPSVLSQDEFNEYKANLKYIFSYIDKDVIESFTYCGIGYKEQCGILSYFKNENHVCNNAYIEKIDAESRLAKVTFFSRTVDGVKISLERNGIPEEILYFKQRKYDIFNELFIIENSFWFRFDKNEDIKLRVNGKRTKIRIVKRWVFDTFKTTDLIEKKKLPNFFEKVISKLPLYKGAWILCDRIDTADDNAEHFYNYLSQNKLNKNAYFLISKNSPDWERLKRKNFKLIPFNSLQHIIASRNASLFISSQCDWRQIKPCKNVSPETKFIFLQHGVTKDDVSSWLNRYDIDLFVTASRDEYKSIVDLSRYKYSQKEVKLLGFPRYDALRKTEKRAHKTILIMPTWRKNLVSGYSTKNEQKRTVLENFEDSVFFKSWQAILSHRYLKELFETTNIEIKFWPHINMIDCLSHFDMPNYIKISTQANESIQSAFKSADLFITDYSSTAFDVAYLGIPIIYYQFDKDQIFGGEHTYAKGYFSYKENGFGSIASNVEELVNEIKKIVDSDFEMPEIFKRRINNTFEWHDNHNCERLYKAISNM